METMWPASMSVVALASHPVSLRSLGKIFFIQGPQTHTPASIVLVLLMDHVSTSRGQAPFSTTLCSQTLDEINLTVNLF
jgi:hypothetical protein